MSEQGTHSKIKKVPTKLEQVVESFIFRSRWLLAPFFIGLLVAVVLLLLKFFKYFIQYGLKYAHCVKQRAFGGHFDFS